MTAQKHKKKIRVQRTPIYRKKETISGRKTLIAGEKKELVETPIARGPSNWCRQDAKKLTTQSKSYIQHSKNN